MITTPTQDPVAEPAAAPAAATSASDPVHVLETSGRTLHAQLGRISSLRLRFTLVPRQTFTLPPYLGSTLRGALAFHTRKLACALPREDCPTCMLRETCAYSQIFESPRPIDATLLPSQQWLPHPIVIEPPARRLEPWTPDTLLVFDLVLFGRGALAAPRLVIAADDAANHGLGVSRHKLWLLAVDAVYRVEPPAIKFPDNLYTSIEQDPSGAPGTMDRAGQADTRTPDPSPVPEGSADLATRAARATPGSSSPRYDQLTLGDLRALDNPDDLEGPTEADPGAVPAEADPGAVPAEADPGAVPTEAAAPALAPARGGAAAADPTPSRDAITRAYFRPNGPFRGVPREKLSLWLDPPPDATRAAGPPEQVTLRFLTPTRLVSGGRLTRRPDLTVIVRSLLTRASAILAYHHLELFDALGVGLDLPFRALLDAVTATTHTTHDSLRLVRLDRYSNRQGRKVPLDGLVGEIGFAGPAVPALWPLLQAGELLHVGKGTVFGLGRYELVSERPTELSTGRASKSTPERTSERTSGHTSPSDPARTYGDNDR